MNICIDSIIERLVSALHTKTPRINLLYHEIEYLCTRSTEIFMSQDVFLQLKAPIMICGDIHGQFHDLLELFKYAGFPPKSSYLFLGDYVDRGKNSIETICMLMAYKIKYPNSFHILRGNHECSSINRIYGFFDECKRRYDAKLWRKFGDAFNCLPISACIDDRILCMHGGISPDLHSLDQIRSIKRPTEVPEHGLLCDLLWSDPDNISGWGDNDRGVSVTFGADVLVDFLQKNDLDLVCRAHQVVEDGYMFFGDQKLVTVFSAPNYCGEYENAGAIMAVDEELNCTFKIVKSDLTGKNEENGRK